MKALAPCSHDSGGRYLVLAVSATARSPPEARVAGAASRPTPVWPVPGTRGCPAVVLVAGFWLIVLAVRALMDLLRFAHGAHKWPIRGRPSAQAELHREVERLKSRRISGAR